MTSFPSDLGTPYMIVVGKVVLVLTVLGWPRIARIMRSAVLQVKPLDYVQAARALGATPLQIIAKHVLPNAFAPVIVVATIDLGAYIATEATLSFLGVGAPPTAPSLGTLIRTGNDYLFSGEWWIAVFPGVMLIIIALSVNLLGDWLRDALNPRLR